MRKHSIRKILHGLLDLLPLFVIPVFMVYSHRHSIDTYSVTVDGANYELNQGVINGKPNSTNYGFDFDMEEDVHIINGCLEFNANPDSYIDFLADLPTNNADKIYCSFYVDDITTFGTLSIYIDSNSEIYLLNDVSANTLNFGVNKFIVSSVGNVIDVFSFNFATQNEMRIRYIQMFNLTEIFGTGNEPSVEQFSEMIGDRYFDYGRTYDVFLPYGTTSYNATDIGSQFIYSMYNVTENYFNTDSVFGLGNLHTWISNNFFNGNMPLGVTVVYHIIVYELIMDIIFLIYAVFMFIVDFASDFLEHCFSWSRKGGA